MLARKADINIGTVSHAVRGTRHTSAKTAEIFARVLGDPGLVDVHRRLAGHGPPLVPSQLPRRSWITGRSEVVEKALAWCQSRPRPALIITGPGGIGKTALAIELGHRLIEDQLVPHGQLFGDFRGWTPDVPGAEITAVVASWCRALGADPGGDPGQVRADRKSVV